MSKAYTVGNRYTVVNFNDRDCSGHRYVVHLGAYGWTRLLVWGNSWDDAIDHAIDWCAENAPGLLCNEQVQEEYERGIEEGLDEREAPD